MSTSLVWLIAFMAAYWAFCIYWGVTAGRMSRTAGDFHLADRRLSPWVFVVTATAMSFSAWTFLGQPAFLFRDGFPFGEVSLGAVAIALTGVVFLKRQWLLGKRFGYVTPADMFADYYGGELLPIAVLVVALVFAVPFVSMQLSASGYLVALLSGGTVGPAAAMWVMTAVVFLYVCLGGIRGAAYVGVLQGLLFVAGLAAIALFAYLELGGLGAMSQSLARLGAGDGTPAGNAGGYFAIPGVVQFTAGLGRELPAGGIWTAAMILTYGFALMGIQASPAFTMWGFSCRSPKSFAVQQVWASAAVVGFVLVLCAVVAGVGGHFLGAAGAGSAAADWLGAVDSRVTADLVGVYLQAITAQAPWFGALLAVCAIGAVQVAAAAFAATTGSMLAHDVYAHYVNPRATDRQERLFARIGVGLVLLAALLLATYSPGAESALGALALAFGCQLWPALAGLCWFPWITRQGVAVGLLAGLAAVVLTEPFGHALSTYLGLHLPWGRWPWTIYSAGWGIVINVTACLVVSLLSQRADERRHRQRFHRFLQDMSRLGPAKRALKPAAWAITLAWFFFALGPGAVFGNDLFGAPGAGVAGWSLGVPSLWAWQVIWWALGVMVVWFLAYKMEMSVVVGRSVQFGGPVHRYVRTASEAADWRPWLIGAVGLGALVAVMHWMFG